MTDVPQPRPTARDVACGIVLGLDPAAPPWPRPGASPTAGPDAQPAPLVALERAVLPALCRPPCLVSFSGGVDSSLVLAIAARVARREGLPDPVPVTWRFTDAPRAEESPWQHRVIDELGLGRQWQILQAGEDLDLVGPVAARLLDRYGPLHPPNRHLHLPIVELAQGGALLTGVGGDQILAGWRRRPGSMRARLGRLRSRLRAGVRHREPDPFPWLHPQAAREVRRAFLAEQRAEPHRLAERIGWHLRRRDLTLTRASLAAIATDHDVLTVTPLLDDGFAAALAAHQGHLRSPSRRELLASIADAELPPLVVAPRRKATFDEVFFRAATREFLRSWHGTGVDESLVDVAALRREWSGWPVNPRTAALVQHAWLAARPVPTPRPPSAP
ncbi:asparagine synthase-related protein [Micromonospora sp. NBC_01813]|uniref:asparagine synthase-related protein n=1 Tax=Micromonospora sp. NBC_01813 TaxID=2975988 RepID=UPI002DDA9AE3|nr:asparagine synthase-related protein [Micromonospora sp. NBC_01813]WSA11392.1 asparagine synthase-related protein [Micromonospora sp. NBC_01813]